MAKPAGALQELVQALRCLPGVGPKTAQRMAFHLLQRDRAGARHLAEALIHADQRIRHCEWCNNFSDTPVCALCASDKRDREVLCVVETPTDLVMLEQTRIFRGLYFVLMGRLSPLDGIGPKDIHLERLVSRAGDGVVKEVVLATNFTVEGDATAHIAAEMLSRLGIKVTRIARGLPVGGELEYVDAGTLAQAFVERRTTP